MGPVSALVNVFNKADKDQFSLKAKMCSSSLWLRFTHLHMFHSRLWSYHWGKDQYRCNLPVCFYTADLNGKLSVCTRLYLRGNAWGLVLCSQQQVDGEERLSHLYSACSLAGSPAHRRSGNYRWCSNSADCRGWTPDTHSHLSTKQHISHQL